MNDYSITDSYSYDDEAARKVLRVGTPGCGCCADSTDYVTKDAALAQLAEYETDLKDELKRVREMRRQVKKFKD